MAVLSFIVSVIAGLTAGWIVYFIMIGGLRRPVTEGVKVERETLFDRLGVMCFRVANRLAISTLGGAVLIAMLGKAKRKQA